MCIQLIKLLLVLIIIITRMYKVHIQSPVITQKGVGFRILCGRSGEEQYREERSKWEMMRKESVQ